MSRNLPKIIFIVCVILLLLKSGISAAAYLWPRPEADNTGSSAALKLVQLTNDYRRGLGLDELVINPRLTQAAVSKAKDILAKQYFSHTSPEGKKFSDWVKEVKYAYFYVGENLAIDFNNPQDVFNAWLKSPKHKENIERKEFQEIGIADLKGEFDGRKTDVVVQLFGSRVLGANEISQNAGDPALAKNYFGFAADPTAMDYFGFIDRYLNYVLFFFILLLVVAIIIRRRQLKKPSPRKATASTAGDSDINIARVSARKQAPPIVSLYTKRTMTANDRSRTSENI